MKENTYIPLLLAIVILSAIIFSGCSGSKPDASDPQREEQRENQKA